MPTLFSSGRHDHILLLPYIYYIYALIRDQAMELAQPISALSGGGKAFFKVGRRGAEHFSSWMLNDLLIFTILERGGRYLFKVQGGGKAKLKPETDPGDSI